MERVFSHIADGRSNARLAAYVSALWLGWHIGRR